LGLEVVDGVVSTAEGRILRPAGVRAEDWAGLSIEEGLLGVERLCALSSWAQTMAYCQALETLAGLEVPPRARYLRVLLAELERVANHLHVAGKILRQAGMPAAAATLIDMWEQIPRTHRLLTAGRRYFAGLIVPGGLRSDLQELRPVLRLVQRLKEPLHRLTHRIISRGSAVAHLVGTGLLTKEMAEEEGIGGPVARASESVRDLRRDQPYAAYAEVPPEIVVQSGGDVFARWMVLILEVFESLRLLETIVTELPEGPLCANGVKKFPSGETEVFVEAPPGPLSMRIQIDKKGQLAGLWRIPPSQSHMTILPQTLVGQQLELVGVIVASWGLCPPCLVR
jgi:Ni,Fe-hydrogenase III large subunit